jgi:hypothetical protein
MVADILTYGGLTKPVTHEKHRTGAIMKVFFWVPRPLGGEYCVVLSFLAHQGEHSTLACLSLQLYRVLFFPPEWPFLRVPTGFFGIPGGF